MVILSTIYLGCDNPLAPPISSEKKGLTIEGKIFDYQAEYKFFSYVIGYSSNLVDSASININGEFKLFVSEPDSTLMWTYYHQKGLRGQIMDYDSVNFNNPTFRYIPFKFFIRQGDGSLAPIDKAKKSEVYAFPKIGEYYVKYYFCNDTTLVSGKHIVRYLDTGFEEITNYNIKFAKGWNQLSYRLIQKNDSTEIYEVSNADTLQNYWVLSAGSFFSSWIL